jgi:hypothetical protein
MDQLITGVVGSLLAAMFIAVVTAIVVVSVVNEPARTSSTSMPLCSKYRRISA